MNPQPQIALVNVRSWALIGPFFHYTGLLALHPLPQVACPILDTHQVSPALVQRIVYAHLDGDLGVDNLPGLVAALLDAGASTASPLPEVAGILDLSTCISPIER